MIKSCLFVLASFLAKHEMGMPGVDSGWMIQENSDYVYTWITQNKLVRNKKTDEKYFMPDTLTWLLIGDSAPKGKGWLRVGICQDNEKTLKVYETVEYFYLSPNPVGLQK